MKKIYKAIGNVHIPSLKSSFYADTRFEVENGMISVGGMTAEMSADFEILVRHGLVCEINDAEASKLEAEAKVISPPERPKMKVEVKEEHQVKITSVPKSDKKQTVKKAKSDKTRVARGLKVIEPKSMPITSKIAEPKTEKAKKQSSGTVKEAVKQEITKEPAAENCK